MIGFYKIREAVCAEYGVAEQEVIDGMRKYTHTDAKRVSVYVFTLLNPGIPISNLARVSDMKTCSIYRAIRRCKNDESIYPKFRDMIYRLTQMLKNE